jgi:hypothetical protein
LELKNRFAFSPDLEDDSDDTQSELEGSVSPPPSEDKLKISRTLLTVSTNNNNTGTTNIASETPESSPSASPLSSTRSSLSSLPDKIQSSTEGSTQSAVTTSTTATAVSTSSLAPLSDMEKVRLRYSPSVISNETLEKLFTVMSYSTFAAVQASTLTALLSDLSHSGLSKSDYLSILKFKLLLDGSASANNPSSGSSASNSSTTTSSSS